MMMGGVEGGGEHGGGEHEDPDTDPTTDPAAAPPPLAIYAPAPSQPANARDHTFTQRAAAAAGAGDQPAPISDYGQLQLEPAYGVVNMADGYESTSAALAGGEENNPPPPPPPPPPTPVQVAQNVAREGQTRFWTANKVKGLLGLAGVVTIILLALGLTGQFSAKPTPPPSTPPPPPPPPPPPTTPAKGPVAFPDMLNWSGGGAVTINVLTNDIPGDTPIDAATLKIVGLMDMGDGNTPDSTLNADGTRLGVTDQGVWTVVDDAAAKTSRITFTPDDALTGNPNAIVYRVSDTAKIESNDGIVVLSSDVGKLAAAITALAGKSDADFWAAYKKDLIDPAQALDIEVIRRVTLSLENAVLMMMSDADKATTAAAYLSATAFTASYDAWTNAGGGFTALYAEIEKITDATTGLGKVRNGTRLVRLYMIGQLILRKLKA